MSVVRLRLPTKMASTPLHALRAALLLALLHAPARTFAWLESSVTTDPFGTPAGNAVINRLRQENVEKQNKLRNMSPPPPVKMRDIDFSNAEDMHTHHNEKLLHLSEARKREEAREEAEYLATKAWEVKEVKDAQEALAEKQRASREELENMYAELFAKHGKEYIRPPPANGKRVKRQQNIPEYKKHTDYKAFQAVYDADMERRKVKAEYKYLRAPLPPAPNLPPAPPDAAEEVAEDIDQDTTEEGSYSSTTTKPKKKKRKEHVPNASKMVASHLSSDGKDYRDPAVRAKLYKSMAEQKVIAAHIFEGSNSKQARDYNARAELTAAYHAPGYKVPVDLREVPRPKLQGSFVAQQLALKRWEEEQRRSTAPALEMGGPDSLIAERARQRRDSLAPGPILKTVRGPAGSPAWGVKMAAGKPVRPTPQEEVLAKVAAIKANRPLAGRRLLWDEGQGAAAL